MTNNYQQPNKSENKFQPTADNTKEARPDRKERPEREMDPARKDKSSVEACGTNGKGSC